MSALDSLRLSKLSLTGAIPSELGALDRLDLLSLNRNQLTGDIPVELFSGLKDLRFLDLGNNAFKGAIPSELGQATKLRGLLLQGNGFTDVTIHVESIDSSRVTEYWKESTYWTNTSMDRHSIKTAVY
jgi:Leucine-rich repeat (LRR) protein